MGAEDKILKIFTKNICSDLNIDETFINDVYNEESSWKFMVQLAQLIEAFVERILLKQITKKRLRSIPQAKRLEFAYEMKLISESQKNLFSTIADIRNKYIHNIENIKISLPDYFDRNKQEKDNILKHFKNIDSFDDCRSDCKKIIFRTCIQEIVKINDDLIVFDIKRKRVAKAEKLLPKKADNITWVEDMIMVDEYIKKAKAVLKEAGLLK